MAELIEDRRACIVPNRLALSIARQCALVGVAWRLAATATWCQYEGAGRLIEMYSYNAAGAMTEKRLRIERGGYGQVDKDVAYSFGSDGKLGTVLYPGTTVPSSYFYDLMDRPIKLTGPSAGNGNLMDLAKDVVYGTAGR